MVIEADDTRNTAMTKQIKFNRSNKDFDMYLDGQYVGSRASHIEAEQALDEMAYEALKGAK